MIQAKTQFGVARRQRLVQGRAARGPPPAPPLRDIPPPPPPPPPPPSSSSPGPPNVGFWTRRNILVGLLVGSGLTYWKSFEDTDPHVTFFRNSTTPDGMQMMITPTGEPYGVTMVPGKNGDYNMLMVDAYGNIYFDPNDRTQGLYIVDVEGNLLNAYVSSKTPGRVELEKLGNLKDIKAIPISDIAEIQLDTDGTVMWAFADSEEPLKINPWALIRPDDEGNIVTGFPGQIDEGVIEVVKEKKSLFSMFKKGEEEYGGELRRDF